MIKYVIKNPRYCPGFFYEKQLFSSQVILVGLERMTNALNTTDLRKITVIYLITPATKYYYDDINTGGYSSTWNNILDTLLGIKHLKLWNYSYIDSFDLSYFTDKTHLSYDGAIVFTKMIRKRLHMID